MTRAEGEPLCLPDTPLGDSDRNPPCFQGLRPSQIHACSHRAADLSGHRSRDPSRESKASPANPLPTSTWCFSLRQPVFLIPHKAGPGLHAWWQWHAGPGRVLGEQKAQAFQPPRGRMPSQAQTPLGSQRGMQMLRGGKGL